MKENERWKKVIFNDYYHDDDYDESIQMAIIMRFNFFQCDKWNDRILLNRQLHKITSVNWVNFWILYANLNNHLRKEKIMFYREKKAFVFMVFKSILSFWTSESEVSFCGVKFSSI